MKIKKFKKITEKSEINIDDEIEYRLYGKTEDKSYWLLHKFQNLNDAIEYYKRAIVEKNGEFKYGTIYYLDIYLVKETKKYEMLDLELILNTKKYNL